MENWSEKRVEKVAKTLRGESSVRAGVSKSGGKEEPAWEFEKGKKATGPGFHI